MFFILSKVLYFLLPPQNWIAGGLLLALLARSQRWRRRGLWLAGVVFFVTTSPLLTNLMLRAWEVPPVPVEALHAPYDVAVVLGGYNNGSSMAPPDRLRLNDSPNRLVNALELFQQGKVRRLLLSGAGGVWTNMKAEPTLQVASLVEQLGVPDSLLLVEAKSRNTYENIVYSKQMIDSLFPQGASVLLITSSYHMRRSRAICQKQGLRCDVFPTDIKREEMQWWRLSSWLLPKSRAMAVWEYAIKEWVGLVVYKLRGYA